jgi:tetratricopeptide (TPR) repeat protein
MAIIKCKSCGGDLEINESLSIGICKYCGLKNTLPSKADEIKANLINRANDLRRNNEFDRAAGVYETILNQDNEEAEAYWGLVLCKYGVEYVEDPSTRRRVPTCHRTLKGSIFADVDYKMAIEYAEAEAQVFYENEAKIIETIQRQILSLSMKEDSFDVFISYKERDETGKRTQDSIRAQELYDLLTKEGFKVFFSRITLEDKLGEAWEPTIFAALNSAKVMVVIGSKRDHFYSPWMKNEWGRYLKLIDQGEGKMLIPAYFNMDAYDLPDEFSHLQAQDMTKLGFMQDLVRGIKKILGENQTLQTTKENTFISQESASVESLLERAFLCLEINEFSKADDLLEQVLNIDPKNSKAYLGKLMADFEVSREDQIIDACEPLSGNSNYQYAVKFGDAKLRKLLESYNEKVNQKLEIERQKVDRLNKERKITELKKELSEIEKTINEKERDLRQTQSNIDNLTRVSKKVYLFGKAFASSDEQLALERYTSYKGCGARIIIGIIYLIGIPIIFQLIFNILGKPETLWMPLILSVVISYFLAAASATLFRGFQLESLLEPEFLRQSHLQHEIGESKTDQHSINLEIDQLKHNLSNDNLST